MKISRKHALAALAAVGAVAAASGGALAVGKAVATAAEAEIITACRHPNGGWVRIVAAETACRPREQVVTWNTEGPPGAPGPAGPAGPKGDPGPGLAKLEDMDGLPCGRDGGGSGEIELDFAGDAQNGAPDGIALVDTEDGALVDALSYEGAIVAAVIDGRTYSLVEGTVLPETVTDSNTAAGSLSRIPDGRDTNDAAADWVFTTTLTRGAANVAAAP